jgi:myo-inositol-1(or 4)-monophosphatase
VTSRLTRADATALLKLAEQTAAAAARALARRRRGASVLSRQRRDVKVDADAHLDALIVARLRRASAIPVLTEESGWTGGEVRRGLRWIVDPLDGSLNHSRGLPLSAISIGLWDGDTPVLGVVHDPSRKEMFSGIAGRGAWINGVPMRTSTVARPAQAVLCTGFPVAADFSRGALGGFVGQIRRYQKVRLLGSAALSLAYVASGRADAYREDEIKVWDVAGGAALVAAAGGRVSIRKGRHPLTRRVRASNGRLP